MVAISFDEMSRRAGGTNVNSQTLLATDYLNHFNEIVMLLEMLPDLPDCLEDARAWRPKSYAEHFADSAIADRDLAIEAYPIAPERYRHPFEQTIEVMNETVATSIARCEAAIAREDDDRLREIVGQGSRVLQHLVDKASAIIHGREARLDQSEIDALIGL